MSEQHRHDVGMKNEAPLAPPVRNASPRRQRGCDSQLDFALPAPSPIPPRRFERPARPCSRERAQWWFRQMRQVVEEGRTVDVAGVF